MQYLLIILLVMTATIPSKPNPTECKPVSSTTNIIFSSVDGGTTWADVSAGLPPKLNPMSFYGTEGEYFLGSNEGLFRGSTLLPVASWHKEKFDQKSINYISPGKAGLYAVALWQGFYQYQPAIGQWMPMHTNLQDKSIFTIIETNNGDVITGCETGIYRSSDNGRTWKHVFKGHINQIVASGNALITRNTTGLWRSIDQGQTWERTHFTMEEPLTIQSFGDELISIVPGQNIGGFSTPNSVFKSSDQGKTWKAIDIKFPAALHKVYDFCKSGSNLVACTYEGIFRSADDGISWQHVMKNPIQGGFFKLYESNGKMFALLVQGC
jgi:ligand-binding sensor domain-containing protein